MNQFTNAETRTSVIARGQSMIRFARILCLTSALIVCDRTGLAQQKNAKPAPFSQRVIDLVGLKDGPAVYGLVVSHDPRGSLSMVVSRDWLRADRPELHTQIRVLEQKELQRHYARMRDRVQEISYISRSLKSVARELKIPVIAISGTPWLMENNAFDMVLAKPFPLKKLVESIGSLLAVPPRAAVGA